MKIFKKILRFLIILHVFPLLILLIAPEGENLEGYLIGWFANLIIIGILLVIWFLGWVFSEDDDNNYDYYP